MKHIAKNNFIESANLIKSLNSLADVSLFNKGNIFKKILKSSIYRYLFLKNDIEQANITTIVKNYKAVASHIKDLETQNLPVSLEHQQAKSLYIIHKSLICLLIQCSSDQANAVPQIAKIAPYDKMNKVIGSGATPYLLRKKYLRLHLQIHLTQYEDVNSNIKLKHDDLLRKLFEKFVCEDLRDFPYYLNHVIRAPTDGERLQDQMTSDFDSFQEQIQQEIVSLEMKREEEKRKKEQLKLEKEKQDRKNKKNSQLNNSMLNQSVDQKQVIKLINDQDPGEYWRYLSYFSNTLNKQDGLLHFITDFFNEVKWQMSKKFVEMIKDKVLANLERMNDLLTNFNTKNTDLVNADSHLSALEDAIKAIKTALERNYELQMKSQKVKKQGRVSLINFNPKSDRRSIKQPLTLQQEAMISDRLAATIDPDSAALPKKKQFKSQASKFQSRDSQIISFGPDLDKGSQEYTSNSPLKGVLRNQGSTIIEDDRHVNFQGHPFTHQNQQLNDRSNYNTLLNNSNNVTQNYNPFNDTPMPLLPGQSIHSQRDMHSRLPSHRRDLSQTPLIVEDMNSEEQDKMGRLFRDSFENKKQTLNPDAQPPTLSFGKNLSQKLGLIGIAPENSDNITDRYFAFLCKILLSNSRKLVDIFKLKEFDNMTQITQEQFIKPIKNLMKNDPNASKQDFGKPREFYREVLDLIEKKQQEQQEFDKEDGNSKGRIQFSVFAEILCDFVKDQSDSVFNGLQKQDLVKYIKHGQVNQQAAQQVMQENLKKFIKKILSKSEILDPKSDLKAIINVIAQSFDFKKASNDQINTFFVNMMNGLQLANQRVYILKVLMGILEKYEQKSKDLDVKLEEMRDNIKNFQIILHIMEECKFPERLIRFLDMSEDEEVSILSIQILIILLEGLRQKIQDQLFEFIREKQDELKVAEYLRIKIEFYTPIVIQQRFNLLRERNMQYMRISQPESDIFLEVGDEFKPKLLEIQKHRKKTISKFTNILRLIQLLCDNCHRGFQDYFRDQLTIQKNYAQTKYQEQLAQETIESTSSFNMITTVARSFMRITEDLKELIFFDAQLADQEEASDDIENAIDFGIAGLTGQFIETLIDFLYGPCEENQFLLSGWKMFLKTLDFYLSGENVFYFAQTIPQEARFMMMEKISVLLMGLAETPHDRVSKKIFENLQEGISFSNLQRIMVDIHKQKIFAQPGSYKIFKSRRRYQPSKYDLKDQRIYPDDSLRSSDERIFEIGFNIFKFLITCKRLIPEIHQLPNTDSQFQRSKESRLKSMYKYEAAEMRRETHLMRLLREKQQQSAVTLNFIRKQIIYLFNSNDDKIRKSIDKYARIIDFLKKKKKYFDKQDENVMKIDMAEQTRNLIKNSLFRGLLLQKKSKVQNESATSQVQSLFSAIGSEIQSAVTNPFMQISRKLTSKISSFGKSVSGNTSKRVEVDIKEFKKVIKESDDEIDEDVPRAKYHKHVQKKIDEFNENQDENETFEERNLKKEFENYKIKLAFQFYSQFVATVEVDYKGTLVRSIFRIPQKCAYLSKKSRQAILYGQLTSSLFDKLETIFAHMNILIAEMKSNQRLDRKSLIRYLMSEYNFTLQTLSSVVVLVINLMYLIFYVFNEDNSIMEFNDEAAYYIALSLSFVQLAVSALIHVGYFDRFHGVYHQKHLERKRQEPTVKFTQFKGSLGFAAGITVNKESRSIVETEMHNLREKFNAKKKKKNKTLYFLKSLLYTVKMYYLGLGYDPIHTFNLFYLAFSIGAIFYPLLFSLLLLENILQIPLLFNVIQAIVNNRKQILLTLLLLFVIVYVYAFIAFMAFRDTYVDIDHDSPALNSYCQSLGFCFTSTLNNGIRSGGGIGDTLLQLPIEDEIYWGRYVFDITFFIMIIILMLNLIFGIIIDSFAAMRDMRNEVEREVKEKCFICGKPQTIFESKKKSFQDHIQREHNVYAYIYYILYLTRKPTFDCTGVERHVQQLISLEDPSFFPIDRALALEEEDDGAKDKDQEDE